MKKTFSKQSRRGVSIIFHFIIIYLFTAANQEIRDYSGKKARQYLVSQEAAVSQDTFRSKYCSFRRARGEKKFSESKGKREENRGNERKREGTRYLSLQFIVNNWVVNGRGRTFSFRERELLSFNEIRNSFFYFSPKLLLILFHIFVATKIFYEQYI